MSSNHPAAGLPFLLFPSTISSTMFFSKHGWLQAWVPLSDVSNKNVVRLFNNTIMFMQEGYVIFLVRV